MNYLLKRRPQPFLYCYCRNFSSGGFSHLNTVPFSSKPSHTFRQKTTFEDFPIKPTSEGIKEAKLSSLFVSNVEERSITCLWWPTTVTAKPKTSRQKQKPHGKNKNITAKPKTSRQKQKSSRQNQILHSKSKIALVLPWVFAFVVRYFRVFGFWSEAFGFAVRSLVLPWGFCFCREVFGFAVMFLFLPWGFGFAVTVVGHRTCLCPVTQKNWLCVTVIIPGNFFSLWQSKNYHKAFLKVFRKKGTILRKQSTNGRTFPQRKCCGMFCIKRS